MRSLEVWDASIRKLMMGTCAVLAGCGDDVAAPGVSWDVGASVVDAGTSAGVALSWWRRSSDTGLPSADMARPSKIRDRIQPVMSATTLSKPAAVGLR